MRKTIIGALFAVAVVLGSLRLGNDVVRSTDFYLAILVGVIPAGLCVWLILRSRNPDQQFLLKVFVAALLVRYLLAYITHSRGLWTFAGGDAITYDAFSYQLAQSWRGLVDAHAYWLVNYTGASRSGFGMFYFIAAIYYLIGQNPFAIQLINCAFGAAVCFTGYQITMLVHPNQRVARTVALMAAFSPSLILWTSQEMKDGPIILCLSLCVLFTLRVRAKPDIRSFILLLASLACLYTLRHYMSYITFAAVAGTLLLTTKHKFSALRVLQGALMVTFIGLAMAYFGAGETARKTIDLERIQSSRKWNATAANSGYGGDVDITDPNAAISFLPTGIAYVLLAPFPWMITSAKQLVTLPELIAWWLLMPMLFWGYWFVVKKRLREGFVLCTLVLTMTLAFALFESNAGTAYRHRSQLYVFFFVFMSIGLELWRQKRSEKRTQLRVPVPARAVRPNPVRVAEASSPVKAVL